MSRRSKIRSKRTKPASEEAEDDANLVKSTIKVKPYEGDKDPIKKHLYKSTYRLKKYTESELLEYRSKNEIFVRGENMPQPIINFSDYKLPEFFMDLVSKKKFDAPTPIQAQSWPICISGKDFIGVARTGSGKTLSYILPALMHVKEQPALEPGDGPIVLVLSPTRELAQQIQVVANEVGLLCNIRSTCVFGGGGKSLQKKQLGKGAEICIATPGRMIELISCGDTNLNRCSFICLDEADRMLEMGFESQIKLIIQGTRDDRQTLMFSATWPPEVQELAKSYMRKPIKVRIGSLTLSANRNILQMVDVCQNIEKKERLSILIDKISPNRENKVLIFVRTKICVGEVLNVISETGWKADSIHGNKTQLERNKTLAGFRRGKVPILVATDVAARGLDVEDISVVINYDYPNLTEDYVHRIGRTARSNKLGSAYTFFTMKDAKHAKELIKVLKDAKQNVPDGLYTIARRTNSAGAVGRYRNSSIFAKKKLSAKERQNAKDQRVERIRTHEANKKLNSNFFDVFNS